MKLRANRDAFYSAARPEAPSARFTGTITTDFTRLTQPGSFTHSSQGTNGLSTMTPVCQQTHTWSDTSSSDTTNNAFLEYNIATAIPSSMLSNMNTEIIIILTIQIGGLQ